MGQTIWTNKLWQHFKNNGEDTAKTYLWRNLLPFALFRTTPLTHVSIFRSIESQSQSLVGKLITLDNRPGLERESPFTIHNFLTMIQLQVPKKLPHTPTHDLTFSSLAKLCVVMSSAAFSNRQGKQLLLTVWLASRDWALTLSVGIHVSTLTLSTLL